MATDTLSDTGDVPNSNRLDAVRTELLDELVARLRADTTILGVALVGSLGAGTEDQWSDLDMLIVVHDDAVLRFDDHPGASPWASADLVVDARHNAAAGAASVGTTYIRERLPFRVDWYAYPASLARWPADSRVIHETDTIARIPATFRDFNSDGPRQPATTKTSDERRVAHLSMVPIAGKYIARRSPSAVPMIEFLGGEPGVSPDPTAQLRQLRAVGAKFSRPSDNWLAAPVESFLDIVWEAIA